MKIFVFIFVKKFLWINIFVNYFLVVVYFSYTIDSNRT